MGRSRAKSGDGAPPAAGEEGALPFEAALEKLESIVERLEQGELPLEEALAAFEEGVTLTRRCAGELDAAQRRIEVLVREGGGWVERPLDETEEEA